MSLLTAGAPEQSTCHAEADIAVPAEQICTLQAIYPKVVSEFTRKYFSALNMSAICGKDCKTCILTNLA